MFEPKNTQHQMAFGVFLLVLGMALVIYVVEAQF